MALSLPRTPSVEWIQPGVASPRTRATPTGSQRNVTDKGKSKASSKDQIKGNASSSSKDKGKGKAKAQPAPQASAQELTAPVPSSATPAAPPSTRSTRRSAYSHTRRAASRSASASTSLTASTSTSTPTSTPTSASSALPGWPFPYTQTCAPPPDPVDGTWRPSAGIVHQFLSTGFSIRQRLDSALITDPTDVRLQTQWGRTGWNALRVYDEYVRRGRRVVPIGLEDMQAIATSGPRTPFEVLWRRWQEETRWAEEKEERRQSQSGEERATAAEEEEEEEEREREERSRRSPSPTCTERTEPDVVENTQADACAEAAALGIKVCDYAYEGERRTQTTFKREPRDHEEEEELLNWFRFFCSRGASSSIENPTDPAPSAAAAAAATVALTDPSPGSSGGPSTSSSSAPSSSSPLKRKSEEPAERDPGSPKRRRLPPPPRTPSPSPPLPHSLSSRALDRNRNRNRSQPSLPAIDAAAGGLRSVPVRRRNSITSPDRSRRDLATVEETTETPPASPGAGVDELPLLSQFQGSRYGLSHSQGSSQSQSQSQSQGSRPSQRRGLGRTQTLLQL
ncbi:hypothetical protein PUNSTDRAFT_145328 [Punctularia strigosozonata HHB-11173 SS5]|uniref:uncharacterized protein n=1 Tax=Punctularia strigosozonata (strain HHB-11173) TaxID=741275 RepID=UPI00044177CF|nr:uncharacterized protein PUNSTDRAFT_145328 [Punctularia strigosozonata HHB-11173 SS5]EIN06881.1 hypothetical protein PUNSTDRAFT_145328 [Punctularia strigosozonata HHB-11173 SS5]